MELRGAVLIPRSRMSEISVSEYTVCASCLLPFPWKPKSAWLWGYFCFATDILERASSPKPGDYLQTTLHSVVSGRARCGERSVPSPGEGCGAFGDEHGGQRRARMRRGERGRGK